MPKAAFVKLEGCVMELKQKSETYHTKVEARFENSTITFSLLLFISL